MKINKISKIDYEGYVYNLELKSNDEKHDDLFWVEFKTGIVTHNCFPKDVSAMVEFSKKKNNKLHILEEVKNTNERLGNIRANRHKVRSK
jgi:hypothetical protein